MGCLSDSSDQRRRSLLATVLVEKAVASLGVLRVIGEAGASFFVWGEPARISDHAGGRSGTYGRRGERFSLGRACPWGAVWV